MIVNGIDTQSQTWTAIKLFLSEHVYRAHLLLEKSDCESVRGEIALARKVLALEVETKEEVLDVPETDQYFTYEDDKLEKK